MKTLRSMPSFHQVGILSSYLPTFRQGKRKSQCEEVPLTIVQMVNEQIRHHKPPLQELCSHTWVHSAQ